MSAIDAPAAAVAELENVTKQFPVREGILRRVRRQVQAVSGVSLSVAAGETVGLVGESGSGKSTLGRLALRLLEPTDGQVRLRGEDITAASRRQVRALRRHAQMVFQDPYSSFDPLLPVSSSVAEPLEVHLDLDDDARIERLQSLVHQVGLDTHHLARYPRELSGGQLQRLAIARALAVEPELVVLDEPVSSLDVSTQAQVINLLEALQRDTGVAFLFIAHNPALVHHASDRIAVMYLGEIVELGDAEAVHERPQHPYTKALLSAATVPDPEAKAARQRIVLEGDVPDPTNPPSGCRFHTRCPVAIDKCATEAPAAVRTAEGSIVSCHLVLPSPSGNGSTAQPARPATSAPFATNETHTRPNGRDT